MVKFSGALRKNDLRTERILSLIVNSSSRPKKNEMRLTKNGLMKAHITSLMVKFSGALRKNDLRTERITSLMVKFSGALPKKELRMAHTTSLVVKFRAARKKNALLMARTTSLIANFSGARIRNALLMAHTTSLVIATQQNNDRTSDVKPNGVISLHCLVSGMKFMTIPSNVVPNSCRKTFLIRLMPNRYTCFSRCTSERAGTDTSALRPRDALSPPHQTEVSDVSLFSTRRPMPETL